MDLAAAPPHTPRSSPNDADSPVFSVSAIEQYLTCPRQFYFGRVLEIPVEEVSFEALAGIAYHEAISWWHDLGRADQAEKVLGWFDEKLRAEVNKALAAGKKIDGFEGEPTIATEVEEAREILAGYIADPRNAVELVVNECRFEVEIGTRTRYKFVGYIDQVRRPSDSSLFLVDLKTGSTRPQDFLLLLNYQLSLYAIALERGMFFPKNKEKPPFTLNHRPDRLALAMLKDYGKRKKNQFAETIETGNKVKSEKTSRMVNERIPNPEFTTGYKIGDPRGRVFYETKRSEFDLRQAETDISRVCAAIRLKQFFRRPSAHGACIGFCRYTEQCLAERAEPI